MEPRLPVTTHPAIDRWLRANFSSEMLEPFGAQTLTALTFLSQNTSAPDMPNDTMHAWCQLLLQQQRIIDQSEAAFIDLARKQGMDWPSVATLLRLPDGSAAEAERAVLAERLGQRDPWG